MLPQLLDGWEIRFDLYSVTHRCAATDIIPVKDEYVLGVPYDVPIPFVMARLNRPEWTRSKGPRPTAVDYLADHQKVILCCQLESDTHAFL